jgi:hypothetical protein
MLATDLTDRVHDPVLIDGRWARPTMPNFDKPRAASSPSLNSLVGCFSAMLHNIGDRIESRARVCDRR